MAAQGFLLIASFILLLMMLARPLGTLLARMINDTPLPGLPASSAVYGGSRDSFPGDELVPVSARHSAV
jgi:hypothetical protein